MDNEKIEIMKNNKGFIAALDQSGGSSAKTLKLYGINEDEYNTEDEMFELIHEMRKRVLTSKVFTNEHILGTILFEKTMNSKVNDEYTASIVLPVELLAPYCLVVFTVRLVNVQPWKS